MDQCRRTVLTTLVATTLGTTAGCTGLLDDDDDGTDTVDADDNGSGESGSPSLADSPYSEYIGGIDGGVQYAALDPTDVDFDDDGPSFQANEVDEPMFASYTLSIGTALSLASIRFGGTPLAGLVAPDLGVDFDGTTAEISFIAPPDDEQPTPIVSIIRGEFAAADAKDALLNPTDYGAEPDQYPEFNEHSEVNGRTIYHAPDAELPGDRELTLSIGDGELISEDSVDTLVGYVEGLGGSNEVVEQDDAFIDLLHTGEGSSHVSGGVSPDGIQAGDLFEQLPVTVDRYVGTTDVAADETIDVSLSFESDELDTVGEDDVVAALEHDTADVSPEVAFDGNRVTATATYTEAEFIDALGDAVDE